jgi:hypothetical protein
VSELPIPGPLGLPRDAVIAVPADGLTVYRLVLSDPPTEADFTPQPLERAERLGWPEIVRLGVSHFLERGQAEVQRRRRDSRVARVTLAAGRRIHVARTGRTAGHVTVWASPGELRRAARIEPV